MIEIEKWESEYCSGAKRANISKTNGWIADWFTGYGKDESCVFEGTWWDMICFARNVLANPNTKQCAPEWYHPEYANDNYVGEEKPYEYVGEAERWTKTHTEVSGKMMGNEGEGLSFTIPASTA